jgi:prepilin-type N-terminal cleavage/methylation domain-containing protein
MSAHDLTGPALALSAQRGFTMVEIITVIAIAAILGTVAIPGLTGWIRNSQVRSATFEMRAVLVRARSEAITRNTEVQLIPAGGDWRNGWTLQTAAGVVIEQRVGLGTVTAVPLPAQTVVYGVDGRVRAGSQVIVLSSSGFGSSAVHPRCVTLNPSGRASTQMDFDFDPADGCS